MNNSDMPAKPLPNGADDRPYIFMDGEAAREGHAIGLTKREYACIHCGVPATGDPELDAIIAEGNRIQKAMIEQDSKPEIGITYGSEGS